MKRSRNVNDSDQAASFGEDRQCCTTKASFGMIILLPEGAVKVVGSFARTVKCTVLSVISFKGLSMPMVSTFSDSTFSDSISDIGVPSVDLLISSSLFGTDFFLADTPLASPPTDVPSVLSKCWSEVLPKSDPSFSETSSQSICSGCFSGTGSTVDCPGWAGGPKALLWHCR